MTLLRSDLRNYQRAGVRFIKEKRKCALFVDMGLGKTAISLTAIADLAAEMDIGRALIIGPQRVVKKTWPDEVKNWSHTRKLTHTVIVGTPKKRRKLLQQPTDLHLVTCDSVHWLLEEFEGKDFPYDAIFIDESSKFKHHGSRRSKAMRILSKDVRYLVLLTGTPMANGLQDLWAQIYLLDRGARLGHRQKDFYDRWFRPAFHGEKRRPLKHAQTSILRRIEDICFTLKSEDYLELPKRLDNLIEIDLPPKVMEQYKRFEREFILEMEDGAELEALSASALYQKLLQLANGVVYDAERNETRFHEEKIEALREVIEEANGDNVFVAYNFKSDVRAIKAAFPEARLLGKDTSVIDEWNRGEIPLLLAHPQSAGHGLNLQFGGGTIAWYGLTWNLENYLQFNKRIHRHGQTRKSVIIHHLIARGTIDETVMKAIRNKDSDQNALLDALKEKVREIIQTA